MQSPICVNCAKRMEKCKIGANLAVMAKVTGRDRPYEVWSVDVHQCMTCGRKVIAQFADEPFWRHFSEEPVPHITNRVWEDGLSGAS